MGSLFFFLGNLLQLSVSYGRIKYCIEKKLLNKEIIYETRYRKISELFIYQYSSIFIHNTHISKLFRYINPCTSMQFHGRLVRNWCGGFGICHTRKWVHHDKIYSPAIVLDLHDCRAVFLSLNIAHGICCYYRIIRHVAAQAVTGHGFHQFIHHIQQLHHLFRLFRHQ